MVSSDYDEAKTPSSLASTPRGAPDSPPDSRRSPMGEHGHSGNGAAHSEAFRLQEMWASARHMRRDTDNLHAVVQIVRGHLGAVQEQLAAAKLDAVRERQAAAIGLVEKDCEIRMVQSEAEAYKLAAAARSSALEALQT